MKRPQRLWLNRKKELVDYYIDNLKDYSREITAKKALKKLREILPSNGIVTTEVGQCQMWASLHFDVISPGTFFSSTGLGTMGFGFPASIGAKAARKNVPVVDIAGDGSFNMTENSLAVSVLEDLPVIVFILNNFMLGMVAQWQRTFLQQKIQRGSFKKLSRLLQNSRSIWRSRYSCSINGRVRKIIKNRGKLKYRYGN